MSARLGLGLRELEAALDAAVLGATGRRVLTLRVPLAGPQLRWGRRLSGPGKPRREGPREFEAEPGPPGSRAPRVPSWLHREATVQDVAVQPEAGAALVSVVISSAAYGQFRKLFPE